MPKEIKGVLVCSTGFSLPYEGGCRLYPEGRHLRGAIGYIALNLGLGIAGKFQDFNWDGVIFRDLLPLSRCGRAYQMKPDGTFKDCSECGDNYDARMLKTARTRNLSFREIREGRKYRLNLIIQDESVKEDVEVCLKYIKENGISFGKRTSSGHGKFRLLAFDVTNISPVKGRGMLLSDCINGKGNKTILFSKYSVETGKFTQFIEKGVNRGTIVESVNGFYVGKYGGLGFGEVVQV